MSDLDDDEWAPLSSRRWLRVVAVLVAIALIAPFLVNLFW